MTPSGATDSNIYITATLSLKEWNEKFEEAFQLPNERNGVRISQHIGPHP
jgi:hypothetical protein